MGRMAPCSRMDPGMRGGQVEVRRPDGHGIPQQVVDVQRHGPLLLACGRDALLAADARRSGARGGHLGRCRRLGVDQRRCRRAGAVAGSGRSDRACPATAAITVGSASTGLTRNPTFEASASTSCWDGGSENATASTLPVELERHGLELLGHGIRHGRRASGLGVIAARSTAGSWARWASAPTTTPGRARFLLISM